MATLAVDLQRLLALLLLNGSYVFHRRRCGDVCVRVMLWCVRGEWQGSGKTLSFVIPLVHHIMLDKQSSADRHSAGADNATDDGSISTA